MVLYGQVFIMKIRKNFPLHLSPKMEVHKFVQEPEGASEYSSFSGSGLKIDCNGRKLLHDSTPNSTNHWNSTKVIVVSLFEPK